MSSLADIKSTVEEAYVDLDEEMLYGLARELVRITEEQQARIAELEEELREYAEAQPPI